MFIHNIYRCNIPTFGISGGVETEIVWVQCVLDSDSNGVADTGACSSFEIACSTNLQTFCNDGFATAVTGQRIDDEDVQAFYSTAITVANDRQYTTPIIPNNVTDGNIIDDNDYDVLKNWLDGTFGFNGITVAGSTQVEDAGTIIDASGWISIRDKLKNMAKLCNDISHCDCNEVCACNTNCTCNCNSNY